MTHHFFDTDRIKARKTPAAIVSQAWKARLGIMHNGVTRADGAPPPGAQSRLITAKDGYDGCPDGNGNMHGPGIVRDQKGAPLEKTGQLRKRKMPGPVQGAGLNQIEYLFGNGPVGGIGNHKDPDPELTLDPVDEPGKLLHRPELGRTARRRVHRDQAFLDRKSVV